MLKKGKKSKVPQKEMDSWHREFVTLVVAYLDTVGTRDPAKEFEPEYDVSTRYGQTIRLTVYPNWIAGKFPVPGTALNSGCNPFTGKWNNHYDYDITPDDAVNHFKQRLATITEHPPSAA